MSAADADRARRLAQFLDQPPMPDDPDPFTRQDRYVGIPPFRDFLACRSCGTVVYVPLVGVHERVHA